MAFSNGFDMSFRFNLDGQGLFFIALATVWSLILLLGVLFLLRNRQLPYIRIRNLPLAISAVVTLHVYWVLTLMAYILDGFFPCSTEYWVMSIYLPFGIALYHASNTQLLNIANLQKQYMHAPMNNEKQLGQKVSNDSRQPLLSKLMSYGATRKTMLAIMAGMVVQFLCTLVIFLISRIFHPSFGLVGHEVGMAACRRGWEWLPSIVWQFTWAWIYAPYLLWKVRHVEDVHGWRTQTVCCCLAGLPASPMWLTALYLPAMAPVNKYFIPPLWFTAGILFMQAFAIFSPVHLILRNRRLQHETRELIAEWEHKQKMEGSLTSISTKVGSALTRSTSSSTTSSRKGEMYTLRTLERTLALNARPLLVFAATKDFSGENISFLTHVAAWKALWNPPPVTSAILKKANTSRSDEKDLRPKQFVGAVEIYCSFVSLMYSDFPINLSSSQLKELQSVFDAAATAVNVKHSDNVVTPFSNYWDNGPETNSDLALVKNGAIAMSTPVGDTKNISTDQVSLSSSGSRESYINNFKTVDLSDKLPGHIVIPDAFGPHSFDDAEASVKQLVLTNTWPKFVNAGYANSMAAPTLKGRIMERFGATRLTWSPWCHSSKA